MSATKKSIALLAIILVHGLAECTKIGGGWSPPNRRSHLEPQTAMHPSLPFSRRSPHLPVEDKDDPMKSEDYPKKSISDVLRLSGGQAPSGLEKTIGTVAGCVAAGVRMTLPPVVACARGVITFYRALPRDAILAQAGLVYCFAGGYYPTLFTGLQAARQCGWETAVQAVDDLAQEASKAVQASTDDLKSSWGKDDTPKNAREIFRQKTKIVFATVDPVKINQAAGALYTTWMGVEVVLQREFAKTIALSMTIQGYLQPIVDRVVVPPAQLCVSAEYHKWIPVLLEWGCKAAAMSVAWRIQRVLSATTSAIAGGLMFSRALARMMHKRGWRLGGFIKEDDEETALDEMVGVTVAGLGLYSQIGTGFNLSVPFPLNLVTWPFDCAEKWIQWQITKDADKNDV